MVLFNCKVIYPIIAAHTAFFCSSLENVLWFFFIFNASRNDKAWEIRTQPILWKAIYIVSLKEILFFFIFFYISNQSVLSSILILSAHFSAFIFFPLHFVHWLNLLMRHGKGLFIAEGTCWLSNLYEWKGPLC